VARCLLRGGLDREDALRHPSDDSTWKIALVLGADVYGGAPMKTNIVLDDDFLPEAATKTRKSLLALAGKIEFAPGYDYKALRADKS
jgi:hypothetical protein